MDSKNNSFSAGSCVAVLLLSLPWIFYLHYGFISGMGAWLATGLAFAAWLYRPQISRHLGLSLVIAAGVSAGIGLIQFMGLASAWSPWISESVNQDAYGNLRQRNQQATLMALGLLGLLSLLQRRCETNHDGHTSTQGASQIALPAWLTPTAMGLVAWLALGSAMTGSRTGALVWVLALLLVFLWRKTLSLPVKKLALWAAMIYAAWVIAMPGLAPLLGNNSMGLLGRMGDPNSFARIPLWLNVIELIAMKPWLGWGWGKLAYAHYSTVFESPRFGELLDNAHNLPLHLAVELGVPIAATFCVGVAWFVARGKPWRLQSTQLMLAWGSLVLVGFHSLLEYPLWYGAFMLTSLFSVVSIVKSRRTQSIFGNTLEESTTDTPTLSLTRLRQTVGLMVLLSTLYLAWDYHRVSQIYVQPDQRSDFYKTDPWSAAQKSWLFATHVQFAQFSVTPLERGNAAQISRTAQQLATWSPEPFVIEKLIQSAAMSGANDVAMFHFARYKAAYPSAYQTWLRQQEISPERKP
jgi:hypothetical protein